MFSYMLMVNFFVLFFTNGAFSEPGRYSCWDDIPCVPLRRCKEYVNFIEETKPLHQAMIDFLVQQQCGFYMEEPKVCCEDIPESIKFIISVSRSKTNYLSLRDERSVNNYEIGESDKLSRKKRGTEKIKIIESVDLR